MKVDIDQYQREGWCLVPSLLASSEIQALSEATSRLQMAASTLVTDAHIDGVFFEVQSSSGRKKEPAVAPGALRKITSPSRQEDSFLKLRQHSVLRDVATQCGVGRPQCVVDQVTFKQPHVGTCFPYHQDASFIHGDAKIQFERHGGINMVMALDDADEDNGGFVVLGRTHLHGLLPLPHGYDTSRMNDGVFDERHRVAPMMRPGDAVLFHPHLAHGSGLNRSARRRRLVTLWWVGKAPPTVC
jgi:hypothetical protein